MSTARKTKSKRPKKRLAKQLRVAVVGRPKGWSSQLLAEAFEARTGFSCLADISRVTLDLEQGRVEFGDANLLDVDAVVVKKISKRYSTDDLDRLEVLRFVEESGVRVFSSPKRIARLVDRLSCTVTLRANHIPMPPTVVTERVDDAVKAVSHFRKAILKPMYSTKAQGMEVVKSGPYAEQQVREFRDAGHRVMYIQKMLHLPDRDLGIVFLGGKYVATYARVRSEKAWNTTARCGGRYEAYEPDESVIELAERAQALFGLDFTCVDVAETDDGPVVFEVSAFGGFRGLKEAHNIDAAGQFADYVLDRIANA